ncbi:Phenylacetaldehyde oxime monooxygenase CYP71AN24 [Linum perenne]
MIISHKPTTQNNKYNFLYLIKKILSMEIPFLLSILLSFPIFLIVIIKFNKKKTKTSPPPPSPPALPLIGNLHQLGRRPHRSFQSLARKHGPIMLLQLGRVPTLVISSAEMAREATKTHDLVFAGRPRPIAVEIFLNGHNDVAFSSYGDYWRHARKLCVIELFSQTRVHSFQSVRREETAALVETLRIRSGTSIDLSATILAAVNNIVARCVLGRRCEGGGGKLGLGELTKRIGNQFAEFSVGDWLPWMAWVDVASGLIGRMKETFRATDEYLDEVIEEHKAAAAAETVTGDGGEEKREDFVHIMLRLQKEGGLDFDLSLGNIKAILVDMMVGGTDTTSTTVEWIVTELVKNPPKLQKAQEEIRRVVGLKPEIDHEDLAQMHYLKLIFKETLRLYPPIVFLLPRETLASADVAGFGISAGSRVLVNTWAIHRDPDVWENPDEFIPERFENNPIDYKGRDFQYIPFGAGRRGCPGMSFGTVATEFVVANLLYWFDWEFPEGMSCEDLDMEEVYALTIHKEKPLMLVPVLHRF